MIKNYDPVNLNEVTPPKQTAQLLDERVKPNGPPVPCFEECFDNINCNFPKCKFINN